jgi:hypothetical protein
MFIKGDFLDSKKICLMFSYMHKTRHLNCGKIRVIWPVLKDMENHVFLYVEVFVSLGWDRGLTFLQNNEAVIYWKEGSAGR